MPVTFSGCYTALATPFGSDGLEIDMHRLEERVRAQAAAGVRGVVPCGTTGESPTLSDEEHRAVVERCIETAIPLGLQVIAGAGSNCTAHAIELHRFAARAGATASLQVNPYYNKPSQEGLYRHFMAIAESADLPVVLYNIPGRAGVALAPATVERLAAHANIQAIKEATGSMDSASEILQRCAITLLGGDDSMTLPFASVGGKGVVSVLSNIVPGKVQALCDAFLAGDWQRARAAHFELFTLAKGLLTLDTNPIPLKAAMELLGLDSGVLRLPMCAASPEVKQHVAKLLKAAGLKPASADMAARQ